MTSTKDNADRDMRKTANRFVEQMKHTQGGSKRYMQQISRLLRMVTGTPLIY